MAGFNLEHLNAKSLTPTPDGHIVPAHQPRIPAVERFDGLTTINQIECVGGVRLL